MEIILVTGGVRSGKSTFAQELAIERESLRPAQQVVYLATALAGDAEMRRRIELHRRNRPARWHTLEEPWDLAAAIAAVPPKSGIVLVDCLTVWLGNVLMRRCLAGDGSAAEEAVFSWDAAGAGAQEKGDFAFKAAETALEEEVYSQVDRFLELAQQERYTAIFVANEVGWGIVPEYYLGRLFRDIAGRVNQQVAARATLVYLVVAGIPLKLKG